MPRAVVDRAGLLSLARRQCGVVTLTDLVALGASSRWVGHRCEDGWIREVHRGVFVLSELGTDWKTELCAALLATGPQSWAAGRSAARLLGLDLGDRWGRGPEVVVPNTARFRRLSGARLHRSRCICSADTAVVARIRTTSVTRTLLDLSDELSPARLARVIDDAFVRGLVTPDRLHRRMSEVGTKGRGGVRQLRQLLTPWLEHTFESVAESSVFRVIDGLGLPPPMSQFEVRGADGQLLGRLDFAWPERLVALEIDGFRWHSTPASLTSDRRRQNELVRLGWTVVRATPGDVTSDGSVYSTLRTLLSGLVPGDRGNLRS